MDRLTRETFASRFGAVATMIGVAVGLGNVWRFPYLVGRFGGAAFVLFYLLVVMAIGIPALMAEWALGRHTRRGPVGAFERGGFPFGRQVGWFFFCIVTVAMGYYSAVIGWVLYYAVAHIAGLAGLDIVAADIMPPASGFNMKPFVLQLVCTGLVIVSVALVLQKGLRAGIERVSRIVVPLLFAVLVLLMIRSLTLPGAADGVAWYLLKFDAAALQPGVMLAAMGQVFFSLSLGGTFMVVYGSYLPDGETLPRAAALTAAGDTLAGILAGFVIFPAVFALGMEPASGPPLLFETLPRVFDAIPMGALFGFLFFAALFAAAYLSDVAALEVLSAGLRDNTNIPGRVAIWLMAGVVWLLSIPPSINFGIFVPWDLTFGSGMQMLGSLFAVLTIGWCVNRGDALKELSSSGAVSIPAWLVGWIRFGIPAVILLLGVWWLLTSVLGRVAAV